MCSIHQALKSAKPRRPATPPAINRAVCCRKFPPSAIRAAAKPMQKGISGNFRPMAQPVMKSGDPRQARRFCNWTGAQPLAAGNQNGEPRQHEHAHHIVVIGGAEHGERQRAGLTQQRQRAGPDLAIGNAQGLRGRSDRAAPHWRPAPRPARPARSRHGCGWPASRKECRERDCSSSPDGRRRHPAPRDD